MERHALDVVLTNQPPPADALSPYLTHRISEQPVSLVARADQVPDGGALADWLRERPLILPTLGTSARTGFDALLDRLGQRPQIAAEVDDMAMMRLLAREGVGFAVLPPIVVKDELAAGTLIELDRLPGITEQFLAITIKRRFPNPLIAQLLG